MALMVEAGGAWVNQSYVKPERLWLRAHPEYSEKWVQKVSADAMQSHKSAGLY
jgi:hypothetical protein